SSSGSCCAPSRRPKAPRGTWTRPGGTSPISPCCSTTRSTPARATWPRRCARSTSTTWKSTASAAERRIARPFGLKKRARTGAGLRSRPAQAWSLLGLVEHALDLEGDRDLLADDDAAAGHRAVVADAEVVPVDLAAGREARPGPAEGVRAEAVHLELERDRLGGAADGEIAVEQEVVTVGADAGGAERHRRVRLDVEEVGAADVVVPVGLTG